MVKIGRNALCSCGSGKKYKKCCMMKKQPESLTRPMIHRKANELFQSLMEYFEENYNNELIGDAWEDFCGLDEDFKGNPHVNMFFRWFLFYWIPDDSDYHDEIIYPSSETIGAKYLKENKDKMDSLSKRVLETTLNDPLSFWQVTAVEPNRGVLLKDLILNRECFVEELSGSQQLKPWDILLANMQQLDGIFVLNITAPYILPPKISEIIKEEFFIDPEEGDTINQLFDLDLDLLDFYQDTIKEMFAESGPELRNMDGKELIFTRSTYIIESSGRKKVIDVFMNTETFDCVGLDNNNNESFLWMGTPENASLMKKVIKGYVKIQQDRLVTKCNSSERDNQLRGILLNLFRESIKHQKTESNPIDAMDLSEINNESGGVPLNLNDLPEDVREQFIENLESMYMKWADQSILALNNLTPREAVKDSEGRKQVTDLIRAWENQIAHMENKQFEFNFNNLRENLGLSLE